MYYNDMSPQIDVLLLGALLEIFITESVNPFTGMQCERGPETKISFLFL